jgi:hydrogenase/urease accessory protein HupE
VLLVLGLALAAAPSPGRAHPLAPALLEVREVGDGRVEVSLKTPLLRARGTALEAVLPPRCRPLAPPAVTEDEVSVRTRRVVACGARGLAGERLGLAGLESPPTDALIRVTLADGRLVQGVVSARQPSLTVPSRPRRADVIVDYLGLGVEHILTGPDHLLFVFGLVLLAGTLGLLGTITAFTVGHSITLTLAVLGVTDVPTRPIEVAIALSILALAIELAREARVPTLMRRWPWGMAAGFGLLHGLGFAAALREAGLPAGEVPLALLSFNAGIEVGQVLFVLLVVVARRALDRRLLRMPGWARRVPVYAMGSLAAFWCYERAAALLR